MLLPVSTADILEFEVRLLPGEGGHGAAEALSLLNHLTALSLSLTLLSPIVPSTIAFKLFTSKSLGTLSPYSQVIKLLWQTFYIIVSLYANQADPRFYPSPASQGT